MPRLLLKGGFVESNDVELAAFYRRYIERCNEHRFDELGEFVDEDVRGDGERQGLDHYVAGCRAVVEAFPDYHWDLQHLLVAGSWPSARLIHTGTHTGTFRGVLATGQTIRVQELALYRVGNGKIIECWGDLGSSVRDELRWQPPAR